MANRARAGRLSRAERIEATHRLRTQGFTHREIAERLDVSVSTVANDLRSSRTEASASGRSPREEGEAAALQTDSKAGNFLTPVRAAVRAARRRLP